MFGDRQWLVGRRRIHVLLDRCVTGESDLAKQYRQFVEGDRTTIRFAKHTQSDGLGKGNPFPFDPLLHPPHPCS